MGIFAPAAKDEVRHFPRELTPFAGRC
jgi:hypothetical protein